MSRKRVSDKRISRRERLRKADPANFAGGLSQAVLNGRFQYLYETWLVIVPLLLLVLVPTVFRWTGLTDRLWSWLSGIRPEIYPTADTFDAIGAVKSLAGRIPDPAGIACWAVTVWALFGFLWRKNYRLLWHPEMYFGLFTGCFVAAAYTGVIEQMERWFGSLSLLGNSSILVFPTQLVQTYRDFLSSLVRELSVRTGIALSLPLPSIPSKIIAMYVILYFATNWLSVISMQFSHQAEVYSLAESSSVEGIGISLGGGLSSDRAIPRNVKLYICSRPANFQISRHCVFVDRSANTGVMLHEMGHVAHKDAFAMSFIAPLAYAVPLLLWVLSLPLSIIPGVGQLAVAVMMAVNAMAMAVYRLYMILTTFVQRLYETSADYYAFRAGYGEELKSFLDSYDDSSGLEALLDPHPKSSVRVDRIRKWTERSERGERRRKSGKGSKKADVGL